ncbi:MAG: 4-(cytidine 5'-diphospho)-2-C-methyl-D-erythritol kinase [Clostridia bacterium]|nr:4-(cytidine 5'-diphospho)-2-C-methyl-D-erythritol kinase [Clostridia bacterium]
MDKIVMRSYAKVNITLDTLRKRDDGYHDVKMIMQSVSLYDKITIRKADRIKISTNLKFLPTNEKNIAYKAAALFMENFPACRGARIDISKWIPVSAGLAGGSSNAAAVLVGLNKLYDNPFSEDELLKMGEKLGSDVPFCITGGTALSEGRGEVLTPLTALPEDTVILIAKPPVHVSTAEVYGRLNVNKLAEHPDTAGAISAIENGDINGVAIRMFNVLETVTAPEHPAIGELKLKMIRLGALGSVMSGSGPSVIGIFKNKTDAINAKKELSESLRDVFVTTAVSCGTEEFKYNERK